MYKVLPVSSASAMNSMFDLQQVLNFTKRKIFFNKYLVVPGAKQEDNVFIPLHTEPSRKT